MAKRQKTGGRTKGTPNKLSGQVREMILAALDDVGGKDYLVTQAFLNPSAFMQLLGKILSLQLVGASDEAPIGVTRIEHVVIDRRQPTEAKDGL
jgi:hypothetical protein